MKNSKREITLNECDSISDMLFLEKSLMREYCTAVSYTHLTLPTIA